MTRLPEQKQGPPPCLNSLVFGGGKLKPQLMFSRRMNRITSKDDCRKSSMAK